MRRPNHILTLGLSIVLAGAGAFGAEDAAKPRVQRHAGLAAALEAAAGGDALVLAVFSAEWCGPCKTLKKNTLDTDEFAVAAAPLHVTYIDVDADAAAARRFQVNAIPHMVLMTAQSQIIATHTGVRTTPEMIAWIGEARDRAARGQWIAVVEGAPRFTPPTDDAGFRKAIAMLGDADPAVRTAAGEALRSTREAAVPHLLEAMRGDYLGTRVGAAELLRRLAPDAPPFDPWDRADARTQQLAALTRWWAESSVLPTVAEDQPLDPAEVRTIDEALAAAVSDDPVRRTDGMTTLIRFGPAALGRVREAIDARAKAGDHKAVWVLEDVRWAILVPDAMEQRLSVRRELARGTSERRQDATTRLGSAGTDALPALRELVRDFDPLVREQAAGALTKVAGPAALDALAVLLDARDTNLRMVAAQALGATQDPAAAKHLVKALRDPDEVVAAVAIAAMEQVKATDEASTTALVGCLSDERWRVRAAAAESLGKLEAASAVEPITALLGDSDPFVVRTAIISLRQLDAAPDTTRLIALAENSPDLIGVAVESVMAADNKATLDAVTALYDKAPEGRRADVLAATQRGRGYARAPAGGDSHWKPLLDRAAASNDPAVRRKLAEVLAGRSVDVTRPYVLPLLNDPDPSVVAASLGLAVRVCAWHWGVTADKPAGDFGILAGRDPSSSPPADDDEFGIDAETLRRIIETDPDRADEIIASLGDRVPPEFRKVEEGAQTVLPHIARRSIVAEHAAWHEAIGKRLADSKTSPAFTVAYFVTGDGTVGVEPLAAAIREAPPESIFRGIDAQAACALVLKRLPWPAGQSVLVAVAERPQVHAVMLGSLAFAGTEARDYLIAPELLVLQIERAPDPAFEMLAGQLLSGRETKGLDLGQATPTTKVIVERLMASKIGRARAVGAFALGHHRGDEAVARLTAALSDADPGVVEIAAKAIAARVDDPLEREQLLGPLMQSQSDAVAAAAVIGLLDPQIRESIGLSDPQQEFTYGNATTYRYSSSPIYSKSGDATPPLAVIPRKPAFLDAARARYRANDAAEQSATLKLRLALLLAQYGEFDALHAYLAAPTGSDARSQYMADSLTMLALKLTGDPRYIAGLVKDIDKADAWDLRRKLQSLEGMTGPEVRDLRRRINARMRDTEGY